MSTVLLFYRWPQNPETSVHAINRKHEFRAYPVGLWDGAQRTLITTNSRYASKVQKAGMIQALLHSSLNGSFALKYN
jgi:hypothetical protein